MADRNSAEIFSMIFRHLACDPHEEADVDPKSPFYGLPKEAARKFWRASRRFDFSPHQLECDEDLIKLGLARGAEDNFGDSSIQYRDGSAIGWEDC